MRLVSATDTHAPERRIAYLWVCRLGVQVARAADSGLPAGPLALLDEEGCVLDADSAAAQHGVTPSMDEHSAVARCPQLRTVPAARYPLPEAEEGLWELAKRYTDRWQPDGLGRLYLEATQLGGDLLGWCQALAAAIRQRQWEPMLGVTGSKFGAAVAAQAAGPEQALVMVSSAQRDFLATQPVSVLPLHTDALLQLRYLGIRSLGQFVKLPTGGVVTRFGPPGRTAQRWAAGLDDRPVTPPWEARTVTARIEFDAPLADRERLLAALNQCAERLLAPLHARFQAVGRLTLTALRADGRQVTSSHVFPQATTAPVTVRLALAAALERLRWDGTGAVEITVTLADLKDVPVRQLTLFDLDPDSRAQLRTVIEQLAARFGAGAFRVAALTDPDHPLPERRITWQAF